MLLVLTLSTALLLQELECRKLESVFEANRRLLQVPVVGEPPLATPQSTGNTIVVDLNGNGDFMSVQAAVNSVPAGNPQKLIIRINAGDYV